jgi:RNA polymerase sigma factor (sigma-70 family)
MAVSDVALMNRWIKESDGEAFAEIVSRHSAMVYGTCVRILRDAAEAEDVTQDCFIKLARARHFKGSSLVGLLHTMATHLSLNRVRAQSRRREREIAFALRAENHAEIDWKDVDHHIDEAIAGLPEKLRHPIIRHFLEGQTHEAIARTLGIDESTVRYRIKKGIEQTRRFLKRRGIPVGAAAVTAALQAQMADAAALPQTLMTALGKLALAGRPDLAAAAGVGVVGTSKLAVIGGTILMWKKISLIVGAIALVTGTSYYTHRSRQDTPTPPSQVTPSQVARPAQNRQTGPLRRAESEGVRSLDRQAIPREQLAAVLKKLLDAAKSGDPAASKSSGSSQFPPYASKDIPPENGAHYFLLAAELIPDIDKDLLYAKWEELQANGFPYDPEFEAMLEKFQDAFDAIRTGLEVGNAEMPPPTSWSQDMSHLSRFRDLARVMSRQAQYMAAQGDYGAAFDDYATLMGFASESSRGGVLISGLVGFAMDRVAAESLRETLTWGGAESGDYRFLIEQMQSLDAEMYTAWEAMDAEAQFVNGWLDRELEAGLDLRAVLEAELGGLPELNGVAENLTNEQIESMLRDVFQDYQALVDYCGLPYYEAQTVDLSSLMSENPMTEGLLPSMETILAQEAAVQAEVRGTMLSAAIELYGAENTSYPTSLSDLVPNYLSEMSEDPFSGEPFEYAVTESGYLLYSVGPDMQDDGGSPLERGEHFYESEGDILIQEE